MGRIQRAIGNTNLEIQMFIDFDPSNSSPKSLCHLCTYTQREMCVTICSAIFILKSEKYIPNNRHLLLNIVQIQIVYYVAIKNYVIE